MKVIDWINKEIVPNGLLCEEYVDKVRKAKSKKQIFNIVCDANGVSFLPEMAHKGHALSYAWAEEEFGRYLNGKYKPHYEGAFSNSDGYTSAMYLGGVLEEDNEKESVVVDTTIACLLKCRCDVIVPPCKIARIVLDHNCRIKVYCPQSSRLIVEHFFTDEQLNDLGGGGRPIKIIEGEGRVRLRYIGKDK